MSFPRRGEIYWVHFDPTIGSEIAKTQPALVISNDVGNQFADRVIVASISSSGTAKVYPFEALLEPGASSLPKPSKVLLDQIRAVDKQRLGDRIGVIGPDSIEEVNRAIRLSLDV